MYWTVLNKGKFHISQTADGLFSQHGLHPQHCSIRVDVLVTQRRSVVKSVGCCQRRLFVRVFVCQHDNVRTSKRRMMKLGSRRIVQKSRPSLNFGVVAPLDAHPPKMWRWATTLGKSAQAV